MNSQMQMVMSVVSKPMLKHKWASKKRDLKESFITCKMKLREGKGVRRDSITHMKEAASHQIEAVTDATTSIGKGFKKSITTYKKEASRFASNLGEFMDVEDVLKSIHQVAYPEEHAKRKTSIVHTPIEWKTYTKPASETFAESCPTIFESDEEKELEDSDTWNEKDGSDEPVQKFQKVDLVQDGKDERKKDQILPIISVSFSEVQSNSEKQRIMSKGRKFSTSAPFKRNNLEEEEVIASSRRLSKSSRRLSTTSLGLADKNLSESRILASSQQLSTDILDFQPNVAKEQKILLTNRSLSTAKLNQSDSTQNLAISTSPTRRRRLSAPHIYQIEEECRSSSLPLNESQLGQMKNSEKLLLTSPNKSYVSSCGRRQSFHNGPSLHQIDSSTNRQRRSSCFLNVNSAGTNPAFRCKSPIIRRKLSNVNLDVSTVGNMIGECV